MLPSTNIDDWKSNCVTDFVAFDSGFCLYYSVSKYTCKMCQSILLILNVATDPEEHPQSELYWGHVNPIGPRACYDEAKRVAETMCYAYEKQVVLLFYVCIAFAVFCQPVLALVSFLCNKPAVCVYSFCIQQLFH